MIRTMFTIIYAFQDKLEIDSFIIELQEIYLFWKFIMPCEISLRFRCYLLSLNYINKLICVCTMCVHGHLLYFVSNNVGSYHQLDISTISKISSSIGK